MLFKIFIAFLLHAGFCHARAPNTLISNSDKERGHFEPYIFEQQIRERLEELREILKNGSPENDIPPLEPIHVNHFHYNFALNESYFDGNFDQLLIFNVSDFQVVDVKFTLFPRVQFILSLYFDVVLFDGNYRILGNLFDIDLYGSGNFRDETKGLKVDVLFDISERHESIFIDIMNGSFSADEVNITFSNDYAEGLITELPNEYTIELLYRIQTNYFPMLLNTLKLVVNDLLVGTTIEDIIHLITGSFTIKDLFQINM